MEVNKNLNNSICQELDCLNEQVPKYCLFFNVHACVCVYYKTIHTHTHTDRYNSKSMGGGRGERGELKISQYLLLLGFLSQKCMNQLHTYTHTHTNAYILHIQVK